MNVIFAEIVIRILSLINDDASVWKSTLRFSLGKRWADLNFSCKIIMRSLRRNYVDVSFLVIVRIIDCGHEIKQYQVT